MFAYSFIILNFINVTLIIVQNDESIKYLVKTYSQAMPIGIYPNTIGIAPFTPFI